MDEQAVDVLIYSGDSARRKAVIEGVGLRPGKGAPRLNWIETATAAGVVNAVKEHHPAVAVLDGETPKVGGIAVAQQIRNELDFQPLLVLLIARPQDEWLAEWAGASRTVLAPFDPLDLQETMMAALREAGLRSASVA